MKQNYSNYDRWRLEVIDSYEWEQKALDVLGYEPQLNSVSCTFIGIVFGLGIGYSSVGGPSIIFGICILIFGVIGYFFGQHQENLHLAKRNKLALKLWNNAQ